MPVDPQQFDNEKDTDNLVLPSLKLLASQVASERATMNQHAESLDTKAGVVLGFAGILVGLSTTAQATVSGSWFFRSGLSMAVVSVLLATLAFFPRKYPVLEVLKLRNKYLMASEAEAQLYLLDTEIEMVREAAQLVRHKGLRVSASIGCLAFAVALIITGILTVTLTGG
jgi:hypothetical protein